MLCTFTFQIYLDICQAQLNLQLQLQLELSIALISSNTPTHPTEKVVNSNFHYNYRCNFNYALAKPSSTTSNLTWAWPSSAPACFMLFPSVISSMRTSNIPKWPMGSWNVLGTPVYLRKIKHVLRKWKYSWHVVATKPTAIKNALSTVNNEYTFNSGIPRGRGGGQGYLPRILILWVLFPLDINGGFDAKKIAL